MPCNTHVQQTLCVRAQRCLSNSCFSLSFISHCRSLREKKKLSCKSTFHSDGCRLWLEAELCIDMQLKCPQPDFFFFKDSDHIQFTWFWSCYVNCGKLHLQSLSFLIFCQIIGASKIIIWRRNNFIMRKCSSSWSHKINCVDTSWKN